MYAFLPACAAELTAVLVLEQREQELITLAGMLGVGARVHGCWLAEKGCLNHTRRPGHSPATPPTAP